MLMKSRDFASRGSGSTATNEEPVLDVVQYRPGQDASQLAPVQPAEGHEDYDEVHDILEGPEIGFASIALRSRLPVSPSDLSLAV